MKDQKQISIRTILSDLAKDSDPLIASLATAISTVYEELGASGQLTDDLREKIITERISALVEYCRESRRDTTAVVSALIEIISAIFKKGVALPPWIQQLIGLATKRTIHAVELKTRQDLDKTLAECSAIFWFDNKTLCAIPVGITMDENLNRFADRLLAAVARRKPKLVLIALNGLLESRREHPIWKLVREEFKTLKISTKFINEMEDAS